MWGGKVKVQQHGAETQRGPIPKAATKINAAHLKHIEVGGVGCCGNGDIKLLPRSWDLGWPHLQARAGPTPSVPLGRHSQSHGNQAVANGDERREGRGWQEELHLPASPIVILPIRVHL